MCGNSYEPELHPGVTYRLKSPKACLKIFSTGSITVTGNVCTCTFKHARFCVSLLLTGNVLLCDIILDNAALLPKVSEAGLP